MKTALHLTTAAAVLATTSAAAAAEAQKDSNRELWVPGMVDGPGPYSDITKPVVKPDPYKCVGWNIESTEKGDVACLKVGEAICRDNDDLGVWKFGLDATKDGSITLWNDKDEAVYQHYSGATKMCINIIDHEYWKYHYPKYWGMYGGRKLEEGEQKEAERELGASYPEEPYMIIYGDHVKYAELWCKGVGNTGKDAQFKMTNLRGFTPTINEAFSVVKFKMGALPDDSDNSLLTVDVKLSVDDYQLKHPWVEQKIEVQSGIHINENFCYWKQYEDATPAPTVSQAPSVSPAPSSCVMEVGEECSLEAQDCCKEIGKLIGTKNETDLQLYCAPKTKTMAASYFTQPWMKTPMGECTKCIKTGHQCSNDFECCDDDDEDHVCREYIDGYKYCTRNCAHKGQCKEDSDCCSNKCQNMGHGVMVCALSDGP